MAQKSETKTNNEENPMRKIRIEKIVLNVSGIAENLEKGFKLLSFLTKRKPAKMKSKKRIPSLNVRPGLEVTVVFRRFGKRVSLKKIKRGKASKKQMVSKEEIIKFMEDNFQTKFL